MARFIETIGGEAAIRQAPARRLRGTVEMPGQGISGTMEVIAAPPDRMATRVEFPGIGVIRSGHDGETAWMIHPAVGPTIMEGRTREQYLQGADFFYPLGQERWTESMRTVEELEFDGRRCYKVRVTTTGGEEYFILFDAETGLQAGSIRTYHSPAGSSETTTVRKAYGEVGGVLVPVRMENRSPQGTQIVEFTELETLEPDPEAFRPPEEVREIIGAVSSPRRVSSQAGFPRPRTSTPRR